MSWIDDNKSERKVLLTRAQAIMDGAKRASRDVTSDELAAVDGFMARADQLATAADRAPVGVPVPAELPGQRASGASYDGERSERTTENHVGRYMREIMKEGRSSYGESTDSAGGYTVPTIIMDQLIDRLRSQMVVHAAGATIIQLPSETSSIARVAADPSVSWVTEGTQLTSAAGSFDNVTFNAKTAAMLATASLQLLQDSVLDFEEVIAANLTTVLAHAIDLAALFGTGSSNQPTGLYNISGIPTVSMGTDGAAPASYNELVTAWQTLAGNNVIVPDPMTFVMAPRSAGEYALLKDTLNQPLHRPDPIANANFVSTTSVPVNLTQGTASTASPVITGKWSDLLIGVRQDMTVIPLRERFADSLQVGYAVYCRMDVQVAHNDSFVIVQGLL
jgi:HK97 family phage major capsid protein